MIRGRTSARMLWRFSSCGGDRGLVELESERISDVRSRTRDRADGELEYGSSTHPPHGDGPRPQARYAAHDHALVVHKQRIDREAHEEHVNARARLEPQALSGCQVAATEQAAQARSDAGGDLDPLADDRAGSAVRYLNDRAVGQE